MFKKIILPLFVFTSVSLATTHSFYFSNDYKITSEKSLSEEKVSTNNLLLPDENSLFSDFPVNIQIIDMKDYNIFTHDNKINQKNWNPLNGFFKYKANELPNQASLVDRTYSMKTNKYYVLNLITEGTDLLEFNFFELKDTDNIETYMHNNRNILIKGDIKKGQFFILNKKYNVDFNDKFIIKFHNKKLELKYSDASNPLFR